MTRAGKYLLLFSTAILLASSAIWAAYELPDHVATPPHSPIAAWAPQGSLLSIEAKDFSALLKDWAGSERQRAWLASDNYGGFSRSRLFSHLDEAQQQFAASAGFPPDMNFLTLVAGRESLFALYDIGNLEFLYITHMPAGAAENTQILKLRSRFETRKAGADSFYVRSQGEPKRTVAFALRGDYLLLATREDLVANALVLMQEHGNANLLEEHWYAAAIDAAGHEHGDLRMALNLTAIVPSPYFRSYWVQQNVSTMKQYTAAVTDLYLTPAAFREERMLLGKSESTAPPSDLAAVLEYLPASAGVYRATAHPATDQALAALQEKLLFRDIGEYRNTRSALTAEVGPQTTGSADDLETRIDTVPPPQQPLAAALAPLRAMLDSARVESMLVTSSTADAPDHLFLPVHSTIVLSASQPWNPAALESALTEALRVRLTAGTNGLEWRQGKHGEITWLELPGLQPLAFAVQGKECVIATDSPTLLQSLAHIRSSHAAQLATVVAGFNHTSERAHFAQITTLLDHGVSSTATPPFFSKNIRSLSDTFQSLDSETFVEQPGGDNSRPTTFVRQTVTYKWLH